jgi:hypothetical protein
MKKNKVIRLTENDLINIIKKVLNEENTLSTNDIAMKEVEGIVGSTVQMYNDYGFDRYKNKKQIATTVEPYKIKDVWFPKDKRGYTVAFTVQESKNFGGEPTDSKGKPGMLKGAFTRDSKHESLPIQFRWDCVSHFEKGLGGKGQDLRRYGGIKENYLNTQLATIIQDRGFCDYNVNEKRLKITPNTTYSQAPR